MKLDKRDKGIKISCPGTLEFLFQHVCGQCFQLLDIIDKLEVQLKLKKGEVQNLYYSSGKPFQEALCLPPPTIEKAQETSEDHGLRNLQMENFINPSNFTESLPEGAAVASDKAQIPEIFKAESPVVVKSQQVEVAEPPKKKDKGLLTSTDLKCQICNKTFEKRRYLMDHLRRVHNSAIHKVRQSGITKW